MNPVIATVTMTASNAVGIAALQAVAGAGNATLTASPVSLSPPRRVIVASDGAGDTTQTVTIYGTSASGSKIQETLTLTGTNAVQSKFDYATVTREAISAAMAGNFSSGTNGVGSTQWFCPSREMTPFNLSIAINSPSGTNVSIEHTYDDPNAIDNTLGYGTGTVAPNSAIPPVSFADSVINNVNGIVDNSYTVPFFAFRMVVQSGTGTATMYAVQSGING